ncbi:class I SAM-dependent methyltransferase [Lichenihabitans sp. Uapishka_5]|uniref:class I SAM-dependent DNA methyltransferase n=1 Tax=Lichenihabitans sp. Uapishka_5 TaxID=3037302 RepID=UPI0029E823CA|nr:class I SAM-dependent methyltransferase [Lichenihabitans sp. Uapishka_5]MDX7951166.1 class I SAM-dependent methyltransferase [Lichenihabitans sp. Uapishka_5]
MRDDTLPLSHFEAIYARGDDPWHFASSAYEAAKYAATLAALPRARYARAYEVGCSVGVLTRALADRCDDLLAVEPVSTALTAARHRNADKPWVRFAEAFVPRDWPQERFDLVVLSEVLDYLGTSDLSGVGDCLRRTLDPGGDVVLVHWIGKKGGVTARPDEASEVLIGALGDVLTPMVQRRTKDYRLDVFRRRA